MLRSRLLIFVWIVLGVAIAAQKHYLNHFDTWQRVLSAALAVLLWPLLLLGIDVHVHK